jgi:hypothetical protein
LVSVVAALGAIFISGAAGIIASFVFLVVSPFTATGAGIAEFAYGGNVITNCFTVVSGAKYAVSGQEAASFVDPKYCYAVSADATYAYKTTGTENVLFKTMSAFTTNRLGMPGIGWNSQWKIEDGQIVFGSYKTSL